MREDWDYLPLGSVVSFLGGGTPSKRNKAFWGGDIPWVSPKDMKSREMESSIDYITQDAVQNSAVRLVPPGAVLIVVRSGILARTIPIAVAGRDLTVNQDLKALCPSEAILTEFLRYFLEASESKILGLVTRGATVHRLSTESLKQLVVPLPSLPEQKRIVAILDEAFAGIDAAIANTEKNLKNARELFGSHLGAAFARKSIGWEEKPVGELAEHSLGKMLDKRKNRGAPKKYLRNLNVRWFEFDLDDKLEMKFEEHEAERYTIRKGDLVICEGGYPGRAAIWNREDTVYFQKALHRVRFHNPDHARWFLYFLYYSDMTGSLKRHFTGTGIKHFTGRALSRFLVPIGPNEVIRGEVDKFDDLFERLRTFDVLNRQKLARLLELKQSILQKAFTGELTGDRTGRGVAAA